MPRTWSPDTLAVHAGDPEPRVEGAVVPPIFQSATFEYAGASDAGAGHGDSGGADAGHADELRYLRLNNSPSQRAAAARLAALERGDDAVVTASGMAAITASLLSVAGAGEHLLLSRHLYGGTRRFVHEELPRLGVEFDLVDPGEPAGWDAVRRPETRAIYVETISNPTLRVPDLEGVVEFGRRHGLVTMIDSTFATPINFRPLELGFDLCLHSATKYLNGHSDVLAGAAVGSAEFVERVRERLVLLGGTLDPHACFLLSRGMMTLGLRVRRQNASAMALAGRLADHPGVAGVLYPGLPDHPGHERARRLFDGFGGMLSFDLGSGEAAEKFMSALEIPISAPSLGGTHSLVCRPAVTSHEAMTPEERAAEGIGDGLVRLSVGIEDTEDLLADVERALGSVVDTT